MYLLEIVKVHNLWLPAKSLQAARDLTRLGYSLTGLLKYLG
jgi:hypothetical protein